MTFNDYQEYLHELIHLKKDSMGLFEIRLLNGDIKCIDPYFDGHLNLQRSYHKIMAQHGLYIDKLIKTNDKWVIAELVHYGHAQEHYQEWAKNGEDEVQKALLRKKLYVDILSQSKNNSVRFDIAKQYPEYSLTYLKSLNENKHYLSLDLLMSQTKPDKKALKLLFSLDWHKTGYNLQILKSKYKAMHKVPTAIEKTMSPFQLYQAQNPLWKQNLSGYNIASVKQGQYKFDNENLILTEDDFNQLAKYDNEYDVDYYITYKQSNRKD